MSIDVKFKNKPKILGLDISTKTIGFALFDISGSKLLELTHFSPKIKPQPEDKIEELQKLFYGYKEESLTPLKEQVGDAFSWEELRMFKASLNV